MSAPTVASRPRPRFVALLRYTLQSCLPPKRWAAIVLPCVGAVLFGLLSRAVHGTPDRAFANVAAEGIFGLVMPIAALVIGDSVLGAEVRAGTFHFTWLTPTPTWQIVLGRWLGGALVALDTPERLKRAFVPGRLFAARGQRLDAAALRGLPGVRDATPFGAGLHIHADDDGAVTTTVLQEALRNAGSIDPTVEAIAPTLEDVFLAVGRGAAP